MCLTLKAGALCPACDIGELVLRYDDLNFKHVTIHGQPSFHCPHCGESFCNQDISRRIDRILTVAREEFD